KCQNNLKQIALAYLNYESATKYLPPAYYSGATAPPFGWGFFILPFIEQQNVYEHFYTDYTEWKIYEQGCDCPPDLNNEKWSSVQIPMFNCPSVPNPLPAYGRHQPLGRLFYPVQKQVPYQKKNPVAGYPSDYTLFAGLATREGHHHTPSAIAITPGYAVNEV